MKRKFLIIFLTIIAAVCMCVGVSACDELTGLTSSYTQSTSHSSSSSKNSSSNSSSTGKNSSSNSSSAQSTEQDQSGTDSTEQSSSGDSTAQTSSSTESSTEQSSSDDSTAQTSSSTESSTEQSSSDSSTAQSSSSASSSGTKDDGEEEGADFTPRDGNSNYGYYQLASETNGAVMQSMYYQMYTACEAFAVSTEDVTKKDKYYTISEISYSGSLTTDEAISVWRVFYLENPMYYWLSSTCTYSDSASTIYLCIDETYASYTDRAAYDTAISAMVTEANALAAQQSTELGKAMAIHDYIISKIDYAYLSDGVTPQTAIWAHNITGVSSMGYGVCEAYAKTYLALCLMNGLDCVIATGYASSSGEGHAWNLVEIDGVWYGVDCTWDDTATDELSYAYFGMNAVTLNSSRTTNSTANYGMDYLYDLPALAEYGIQLVTLFKGEESLGIYLNIDAAFTAMTDSTADYTIELYYYNSTGTLVYTTPETTMYIYSASTPAVNSITINGIYTDLGDNTFYVSYLSMANKLTLNCNLEISNIILNAAEFDLGNYTLTTSGYYCQLNGVIYDSKTTEVVSINSITSSQTAVYGTITVSYYRGNAMITGTAVIGTYYGSSALNIYGGTVTIDKYISANETNYYNIYLQKKATLSVNNLVYDSNGSMPIYILFQFDSIEEYSSLYLGNVDAQTYLFISGTVGSQTAAPSNLSCAVAVLGDANDFTYIRIYFGNDNKTSSYTVNSSSEIIYNG